MMEPMDNETAEKESRPATAVVTGLEAERELRQI
jgi:hypothetical protein